MGYTLKHKLKRILIKTKLLPLVNLIYERIYELFTSFSPKYRDHQRKVLNFYSQFIKKGDLCFDVGAHKGNRTEIFLKLGARVVAIEPQERCVRYLQSKFGKNPQFSLVKKGLSDKEGKLVLSICEEADSISTFSEKWKTGRFSDYKWNKKKTVPVTTLDNLIKEFGEPIFCKIDVEGFELRVLKGLSQPIKYLSFEFTKEFFEETKSCLNYLLSLGPVQFNCNLCESMQFLFSEWVTAEKLCEKINSLNENLLWGDIYVKFFDN